MSNDLRDRLAAADPAGGARAWSPARQSELTGRILDAPPARRGLLPSGALRTGFRRPASLVAASLVAGLAAVLLHSPVPAKNPELRTANSAGRQLDDIARIAAVQPAVVPGRDQFFYTRSVLAGSELTRDARGEYTVYGPLPALSTREAWAPQDPTRKGYFREGSVTTPINPQLGGASSVDLAYAQIAALPTDPARLLAQVRAGLPAGYRDDENQGAFSVVLGYLKAGPPPAVAGALYRAAALIPGVRITPDARDATGRHGVGLYYDAGDGLRDQYVVDPATARYLGSDQYVLDHGRVRRHVATEALLASGVAERAGQRP